MVKYLEIYKCEDCPHHQLDPQTMFHLLWGRDVCMFLFKEDDEASIKIIDNMDEIPDWCPLDGPNDL